MRKQLGFALAGIVFTSMANASSFIIDPFSDAQNLTATNGSNVSSNVVASGAIGGHRYASITQNSGIQHDTLNIDAPTANILDFSMLSGDTSDMRLLYDGTAGTTGVNAFSLGGIDLTEAGALSLIRVHLESGQSNSLTMNVYTDASDFSTATINYSNDGLFHDFDTAFTSFGAAGSLGGADFTNVNAFEVTINGVPQQDLEMGFISAEASSVPEPSTMLLLGGGLVGLGVFSRRRRRS